LGMTRSKFLWLRVRATQHQPTLKVAMMVRPRRLMSRRKTSVVVRREGAGGGGWDEVSVLVNAVLSKIRDRFGGNLRAGWDSMIIFVCDRICGLWYYMLSNMLDCLYILWPDAFC
jgi:hypothetical protein